VQFTAVADFFGHPVNLDQGDLDVLTYMVQKPKVLVLWGQAATDYRFSITHMKRRIRRVKRQLEEAGLRNSIQVFPDGFLFTPPAPPVSGSKKKARELAVPTVFHGRTLIFSEHAGAVFGAIVETKGASLLTRGEVMDRCHLASEKQLSKAMSEIRGKLTNVGLESCIQTLPGRGFKYFPKNAPTK
jgi:hypothetical protein